MKINCTHRREHLNLPEASLAQRAEHQRRSPSLLQPRGAAEGRCSTQQCNQPPQGSADPARRGGAAGLNFTALPFARLIRHTACMGGLAGLAHSFACTATYLTQDVAAFRNGSGQVHPEPHRCGAAQLLGPGQSTQKEQWPDALRTAAWVTRNTNDPREAVHSTETAERVALPCCDPANYLTPSGRANITPALQYTRSIFIEKKRVGPREFITTSHLRGVPLRIQG